MALHGLLVFLSLFSLGAASSATTQKLFKAILEDQLDKKTVTVANLANPALILGSSGSGNHDAVSLVPNTNIALFDCSEASPHDVEIAVGVSGVLVCQLTPQDFLREVDTLPTLQAVMESVLWGSPSEKKHIFIVCEDCVVNDSDAAAAVRSLVSRTWQSALKPLGAARQMEEMFHLHVTVLPHRRRSPSDYSARVGDLRSSILALGAAKFPEDLQASFVSAAGFSGSRKHAADSAFPTSLGLANAVCDACLDTALNEFVESFKELGAELAGSFDSFGEICNEAMDQALGTFDALVSDQDDDRTKDAKRSDLQRRLHRLMEPIYREQLRELDELAWDRLRKNLSKLRVGSSLLAEMEAAVQDAENFFRDTSKNMLCRDALWSADFERRAMATKMRRFVTERLQAARLQGSYVPGMLRRPVAVSLHYLAMHPFSILDSLQDRLSYDEEMEWEPAGKDADDGKNLGASDLPKEITGASKRMSIRAER
jgi:hypothetical protein